MWDCSSVRGAQIWWDPASFTVPETQCQWSLTCPRCAYPYDASIIFVRDPADFKAKLHWLWAAVLKGLFVLHPDAISGGPSNIALKYKAATAVRREVFFTEAFREAHSDIATLIRACIRDGPAQFDEDVAALMSNGNAPAVTKWSIIDNECDFLARKALLKDARVIAVASRRDQQRGSFKHVKHVFTAPELLAFIRRIDHANSFLGTLNE